MQKDVLIFMKLAEYLMEDISFRSTSTAVAFVFGNVSNGFRVWKVEKSIDLGMYKENIKNGRY